LNLDELKKYHVKILYGEFQHQEAASFHAFFQSPWFLSENSWRISKFFLRKAGFYLPKILRIDLN